MKQLFLKFIHDKRGDFAQFAVVAPILMLVSLGLVNLALFGVAGVNANNAANYGARVGSVAQENAVGYALKAANSKLHATTFGDYAVSASQVNSGRGSLIRLSVTYSVDNYLQGLAAIFGVQMPGRFQKTVTAYFRHEGW
jgi:Flp pilus assembly protein TadG